MTLFVQISLLFFFAIIAMGLTQEKKMDIVYEWKYIDYVWSSESHRVEAIESGNYSEKVPVLFDVDRSQDGKTFVTVVGGNGVPATLAVVSDKIGPGGPLLEPYPDWKTHEVGDCSGITSVYRIAIDKCNRLWVLDTGVLKGKQKCPAKLLVFNLETNTLNHTVTIKDKYSQNSKTKRGLLITPIVQTEGDRCIKSKIYIADAYGNGLLIGAMQKMWRLDSPNFEPESTLNSGQMTIAGDTFTLGLGLFGMSLAPAIGTKPAELFFGPFASRTLYSATVDELTKTKDKKRKLYLKTYNRVLPSQSTAQAFSSRGVLYLGLTNQMAIGCWNRNKFLIPENIEIAAQDDATLQFTSGMKVIPPSKDQPEELWVLTNCYQKIASGTIDYNEVNMRIMKQSVKNLNAGTSCEKDTETSFSWWG